MRNYPTDQNALATVLNAIWSMADCKGLTIENAIFCHFFFANFRIFFGFILPGKVRFFAIFFAFTQYLLLYFFSEKGLFLSAVPKGVMFFCGLFRKPQIDSYSY